MRARCTTRSAISPAVATLIVALTTAAFPVRAPAQVPAKTRNLAQKLVDEMKTQHPEADEIGISATTARGCVGIASTDKSDIGEKCETDDIKPMQTGKPYVAQEKDGFDVSLPLHDASGKTVGVIGVGFKAAPGQTRASVTAAASRIEAAMAAQIPSKAVLLASAT